MNLVFILALLAGLLLIMGIVAIVVILAVAKRSKARILTPENRENPATDESNAWEEAGKRLSEDDS